MSQRFLALALAGLALCLQLVACAGPTGIRPLGIPSDSIPIEVERFMGDWYVIAHIPMAAEADAYEAVESYELAEDGTIDVRFRFCDGAVDGPLTEFTMRGWVYDPATNAEWRIRPVWPLRFRYQIIELDPQYTATVVVSGENAWVMARRPQMDEAQLEAMIGRLAERGFETDALRRVPHEDGVCRADT